MPHTQAACGPANHTSVAIAPHLKHRGKAGRTECRKFLPLNPPLTPAPPPPHAADTPTHHATPYLHCRTRIARSRLHTLRSRPCWPTALTAPSSPCALHDVQGPHASHSKPPPAMTRKAARLPAWPMAALLAPLRLLQLKCYHCSSICCCRCCSCFPLPLGLPLVAPSAYRS